ncbi:sulfotransferase domain-containing protein [bacterium]|nr:sulfotransferase domain-containing protein [bacterium]
MPNLLIVGAMKAGTSSLHDYLNLHPDVYMSEPKEIHYYADGVYGVKSKEWYTSFFKSDKKIVGTTPQSYTKCHNKYYQNIPERIFKDTPNVKLIYIVRDPIKRYESHVLESYHCDTPEDVEYSKSSGNYIKTSMYGMQLKEYLKYFDLKQFYILSLEDLHANRLKELNKIFKFLGVSQLDDEKLFDFEANVAESKEIPTEVKQKWIVRLTTKLSPYLGRRLANYLSAKFYAFQLKKPVLTKEEKESLELLLRDDIIEFKKITGKSFDQWSI